MCRKNHIHTHSPLQAFVRRCYFLAVSLFIFVRFVVVTASKTVQIKLPTKFPTTKHWTTEDPTSIFYKSIAGRYRPVSYPNGPITARFRFIKNAYWDVIWSYIRTKGKFRSSKNSSSPVFFCFCFFFVCFFFFFFSLVTVRRRYLRYVGCCRYAALFTQ